MDSTVLSRAGVCTLGTETSLCARRGSDPRGEAETRVLTGLTLAGSVPTSRIPCVMCPVRRLTSKGPLHPAPTCYNLLVLAEGRVET